MMEIETLNSASERVAAARSRLYRLLADGFLYPEREAFDAIERGRVRDEVVEACRELGWAAEPALDGLVASGDYVAFQADYLRLFEVGQGMPPCPLYSGIYRGGRKAVMEELARFYSYFGLSIEHGSGELPDHVATELEFLHFLAFKELAALHARKDAGPYRRAQADFLERQMMSWLPALERRLRGLGPPPFYSALVWLTNAATREHLAALNGARERFAAIPLEEVR